MAGFGHDWNQVAEATERAKRIIAQHFYVVGVLGKIAFYGAFAFRDIFYSKFFGFFTTKILLFLHQSLKFRKPSFGRNWCKKIGDTTIEHLKKENNGRTIGKKNKM